MIVDKFLTRNPYYNDGRWISGGDFRGFFLHSVGVGQPDPLVFWRAWNRPDYTNAGINGFIGADATYITAQCLTQPGRVKRMPHGGKPTANNHYIGFEMCEPAQVHYIGYGAAFTVSDLGAAQAFCQRTYANAVELFARLCSFHDKDPLAPGVIYSHNEGGKLGIASGHVDPEHLWSGLRLPYTMDGFRRDVKKAMEGDEMTRDEIVKIVDERIKVALEGKDTLPSSWAEDELAEATAAGITDGTRPQGYAKREEVAAMVLRGINQA